ncbi:MAG: hypothetical protein RR115_02200 [Hydrogenoanaerobacterium sp.]
MGAERRFIMKCKLMGIQTVDFINQETGEQIKGSKLHLVSELDENASGMYGHRVASVFTKLDIKALKIGGGVELIYEQPLGSTKSRLVSVNAF